METKTPDDDEIHRAGCIAAELQEAGFDAYPYPDVGTVKVDDPDDAELMYKIADEVVDGVTDIRMTTPTMYQILL